MKILLYQVGVWLYKILLELCKNGEVILNRGAVILIMFEVWLYSKGCGHIKLGFGYIKLG